MTDRRGRITKHLQRLAVERHPTNAPLGLQQAQEYLTEQFVQLRWDTAQQTFQAWGKSYHNILAVKSPSGDGTETQADPILIGAHYDTVMGSPGADDNASALVVLLEAALELQAEALSRPVWIVAFCLEEHGLLGSRAFISHIKESGQNIAGAIVLECVGYTDHRPGSQRTPSGIPLAVPTTGDFLGIIGNELSRELVAAVVRSAPPLPVLPLVVPGQGSQFPDVRRSDHAAFWDQGYPAIMLTDTANFRNPHYHQPTDTIDTLDLCFIEAVSETVVAATSVLAGNPFL